MAFKNRSHTHWPEIPMSQNDFRFLGAWSRFSKLLYF